MLDKPIAVLGGGNGAHMMAGDFTLAGYRVKMFEHPNFAGGFQTTLETKRIKVSGIGRTGVAELFDATTDIKEVLKDVELINVVVPAFGHGLFFNEMLPHLKDGQKVVIWAGNFGSLLLRKLLKEQRPDLAITIAEVNSIPYGTRLKAPADVELALAANRVILATLPADQTKELVEQLKELVPVLEAGDNVLSVALSNPNPICHPPGSLLNVGRIQYSGGEFYMYREGVTEAVARVIKQLYEETVAVGKALGVKVLEYDDREFRTPGTIMAPATFEAPFDTLRVIGNIKGPKSIQDRYITEDLPFSLVLMSQLGDKFEVDTPIIDSIINIGAVVCKCDFWEIGRTMETLGIEDFSKDEILNLVG